MTKQHFDDDLTNYEGSYPKGPIDHQRAARNPPPPLKTPSIKGYPPPKGSPPTVRQPPEHKPDPSILGTTKPMPKTSFRRPFTGGNGRPRHVLSLLVGLGMAIIFWGLVIIGFALAVKAVEANLWQYGLFVLLFLSTWAFFYGAAVEDRRNFEEDDPNE